MLFAWLVFVRGLNCRKALRGRSTFYTVWRFTFTLYSSKQIVYSPEQPPRQCFENVNYKQPLSSAFSLARSHPDDRKSPPHPPLHHHLTVGTLTYTVRQNILTDNKTLRALLHEARRPRLQVFYKKTLSCSPVETTEAAATTSYSQTSLVRTSLIRTPL